MKKMRKTPASLPPSAFSSRVSRSSYGGDLGSTGAGKPKLQCRGSVYPYNGQTANLAADEAEYALAA